MSLDVLAYFDIDHDQTPTQTPERSRVKSILQAGRVAKKTSFESGAAALF